MRRPGVFPPNPPPGWTKVRYAHVVEGCKLTYPVGTLVTYRANHEIQGRLPILYRVEYHEENMNQVTWDYQHSYPECLTLRYEGNVQGMTLNVAPNRMRTLTTAELALVNLSNRPTQGSA